MKRSQNNLFIISITYKSGLEEIDRLMEDHVAFLEKYFKAGLFLVAGRKIPRKGGVIICRGEAREKIKKIMSDDPFVKLKSATYTLTVFRASMFHGEISKLIGDNSKG